MPLVNARAGGNLPKGIVMDLKEPITTQERLDEILKERLERAKEQVRSEESSPRVRGTLVNDSS